jgi:hypothetical protein
MGMRRKERLADDEKLDTNLHRNIDAPDTCKPVLPTHL